MPASSVLGDELPRNIQDLLQAYFRAKNTSTVPAEIYCIQVPRVNFTVDGKRAIYIHNSGEHVEVRGYTLPSMIQTKGSERLLVAVARAFPQPIILARMKPHGGTFRQWYGAADDGSSPPIITRRIPEHGSKVEHRSSGSKVAHRRRKSSIGTNTTKRQRVNKREDEEVTLDASEEQVKDRDEAHRGSILILDDDNHSAFEYTGHEATESTLKRRGSRNRLARTVEDEDDEEEAEPSPDVAERTAQALTPVRTSRRGGNRYNLHKERPARDKGRSTSLMSTSHTNAVSAELLPETTPTVAENTTFHFISSVTGEKVRKRALAKIDNVEVLFTHAYAADVIPIDPKGKKLAALEARIGDYGEAIRVVDDEDFGDLIGGIVQEGCWEQGVGCEVYVTGLGEYGIDDA